MTRVRVDLPIQTEQSIFMNDSFHWPDRKRAALSFSFDDTRVSQADCGLPILDAHGVRATFYATFSNLEKRLELWRGAVQAGHELANHSTHHPCGGNYHLVPGYVLEDYTLPRMEEELLEANAQIEELLHVKPQTFAYPCGQKFVGRGLHTQSYVPLVAKHFLAGRGFRDQSANIPGFCDLAQLHAIDADSLEAEAVIEEIERALKSGNWLILAMHEVGPGKRQSISPHALESLCRFVRSREDTLWTGTVAEIAAYVQKSRENALDSI
jgi:peptidoglycan/xylan/chitin deacetylase (PgdA/CDA1 family)